MAIDIQETVLQEVQNIERSKREKKLTWGHTAPQYDKLKPFEAFPKRIEGETVWDAKDYKDNAEKWVHRFTTQELDELSSAADAFAKRGLALTDISKETFRLSPEFEQYLSQVKRILIDGRGFILFKGFETVKWSIEKVAAAYMGLGSHLGEFVAQNGKGHILGHVKDLGNDPTQIHKVRIYSTNARQFFHVDSCDIVGLLCLHRAQEGGESDIVSSHHVYNILSEHYPDVLETFTQPIWYFDHKGEVSKGGEEYFRAPIAMYHDGRIIWRFDPYYVRSLKRFWESGELPPLSKEQNKAMEVLEQVCLQEALHMILEVGDVQFVSCNHVLHARTAYIDHPPPAPRRQLMRLWLATPESQGGWSIPYHDSDYVRRGGIQVDDNAHTSPLDAE